MRTIGSQPADPIRIWTVTDGRAGIENQALGLAEAIARRVPALIQKKRIRLRTPFRWLPPGFTPAPLSALSDDYDQLKPPWPDLWIGCGRQSVALSMGVRAWSHGKTFVAQLQDPRVNVREFDLVLPPVHDGLEGQNVLPLIGAAHRVTLERIAAEAAKYPRVLAALPGPRLAVLIGGKSKRQDISAARAGKLAAALTALKAETGGSLMVTLSRRTGTAARRALEAALNPAADVWYDPESAGAGENPLFAMLAAADAIFVTADSVNMAAEAAATGKPIHLLPVDGAAGKLTAFHDALTAHGAARWWLGGLETWDYAPLAETDRAAKAVLAALEARRG